MSRLIPKSPAELEPAQREAHERIAKFRKPRVDHQFGGPFDPWVRSPELARRAVDFGNFLWERTTLERRIVELAILVTARFWRSNVEWYSHSARGLEHGLAQSTLDAIMAERRPESRADEQIAYDVSRALHTAHELAPELYARGVAVFGEQGLAELCAVNGYYTLVAMTLASFDVGLAPGAKEPFPR